MILHANNIRGLGALVVTYNIICQMRSEISVILSSNELLQRISDIDGSFTIRKSKYSYLKRIIELLLTKYNFQRESCLVMGDIPLKIKSRQIVFFHNLNLLNKEKLRTLSSLKLFINQALFKMNLKYVNEFVVQSRHAERLLLQYISEHSRLDFTGKVSCIEHNNFYRYKNSFSVNSPCIQFFYPARAYPHKNHEFLLQSAEKIIDAFPESSLVMTIESPGLPSKKVKFLGEISSQDVRDVMARDDVVLLFPSEKESLGLPLLEALEADIPIVVADLPYARELCGDSALYFEPNNIDSLISALKQIQVVPNVHRETRKLNIHVATADHIRSLLNYG